MKDKDTASKDCLPESITVSKADDVWFSYCVQIINDRWSVIRPCLKGRSDSGVYAICMNEEGVVENEGFLDLDNLKSSKTMHDDVVENHMKKRDAGDMTVLVFTSAHYRILTFRG